MPLSFLSKKESFEPMERYICIHGHFYQPPRENPWLEAIELQDPAYPYHDWNERITAECYATNAKSRILDEHGRIVQMVNNYAKISFNFGPTLLAWLEEKVLDVYGAILEADQASQKTFSGHGSALAQAYNHMILPLANQRDKHTQIVWGIRDFEHRFGRKPEGMWLPEAAVDLETLDILAEQGIRFTILAPHQASRLRPMGTGKWRDVRGGKIDPTSAYALRLPSGRAIALFFYDGPISRAVAFEGLLKSGQSFAQRLLGGFSEKRTWPQIVHIATDGETYGHHHHFGDMALAYALHHIESENLARLTNYGEYLERHPPTHEVEILENTSWSCVHGVERWRSDCGCNSGRNPGWHQAWRTPLRKALDWLRDSLASTCEEKARQFLKDPWGARNDYIQIILDRSPQNMEAFFNQHAARVLNDDEKITALKMLELQRHAMLMYTSCGWFFDELSGIETVQVIQYAGRALQLAQEVFGQDMESRFLELLEQAKSNVPKHRDGRRIYERFVKPAIVDLVEVGAHYAMSSLFQEYGQKTSIYCYTVDQDDYQSSEAGRAKLVAGRATVTSQITRESARFCFGVLHLGDHNLNCGVRGYQGQDAYQELVQEIMEPFGRADFAETIRILDKYFEESTFSLTSLFRDEQRKILDIILESTLADVEALYRQLYETNAPLMRFLKDSGTPPPKALYAAAEAVLNADLRRAFENEEFSPELVDTLLDESRSEGISLDQETLEYTLRGSLERMVERLVSSPMELEVLEKLNKALGMLRTLPFQVNLWKVQNIYYDVLQTVYLEFKAKADRGDERARQWLAHFAPLGEKLSIRVE
jgi:alpha-amylase/alpha-mannosidase (GH57 family)